MAGQTIQPASKRSRAPGTALFVLTACLATPALAATPHKILCSEADDPDLEIPDDALTTEVVHHDLTVTELNDAASVDESAAVRKRILEPRAKAVIREAFEEVNVVSDEEAAESENADDEEIAPRIINTRLPGISEERMGRFKRQMYRRDI